MLTGHILFASEIGSFVILEIVYLVILVFLHDDYDEDECMIVMSNYFENPVDIARFLGALVVQGFNGGPLDTHFELNKKSAGCFCNIYILRSFTLPFI